MISNLGWIKIHRSLLDWEWYTDINCKVLFIHLLLTSNVKDKKWRGVMITKGSRITGRIQLSNETGLSEQQVRTALKKLLSTKELTTKKTSVGTVYSVINWKKYQIATTEQPEINQTATREQPESNQRVTTTKEVNNINNTLTLNTSERDSLKNIEIQIDDDKLHDFKYKDYNEFLKDWNKARKHFEKKESNISKLSYDELNDFKRLKQDFTIDDFKNGIRGLFMQKQMFATNRLRPRHFLQDMNIEKYIDCHNNKTQLFQDKAKNQRL